MEIKDLESIKRELLKMKKYCSGGDPESDDIKKSIMILESKVNHYLTNHDALESLRNMHVGDKKQ